MQFRDELAAEAPRWPVDYSAGGPIFSEMHGPNMALSVESTRTIGLAIETIGRICQCHRPIEPGGIRTPARRRSAGRVAVQRDVETDVP